MARADEPASVPHIKLAPHMPGEAGIWMFIFGDMLMFSLLFLTFAWYRGENVELYAASQAQLNQVFGVLNTFLMLSSSWFVAQAIQFARRNRASLTALCFGMGFLCGLGFGVVKVFEYGEKIRAGLTPMTNDFYMYYYVFTGIHFMHVLIGMGVLAFMAMYARAGVSGEQRIRNLESGASFWHVVDLLWIVLFALLYLAP
ncbi:MAG: cytochrome c oxidase subunit 3 family protein [Panacagrimonas sp.]